ncbi:hypothetical protein ABT272_44775 [Streptomyces sp900105245]|uniref:Uncharacterized protein n=1 Tax=Streptomyces sp. 900105245 TaxID=3154379 RepID=A0ABV1ULK4_9ACTN
MSSRSGTFSDGDKVIDVSTSADDRDEPGPATSRTLGLDEITHHPVTFKCMGRRYTAARTGSLILIQDTTDITHPLPLGTAEPNNDGTWRISTTNSRLVRHTRDAVASLREATWPPRDTL